MPSSKLVLYTNTYGTSIFLFFHLISILQTRCLLNDPERLRPAIDEFLERSYQTDVCLLFPPSQIALAAVLQSASSNRENLDSYVTGTLLGTSSTERLPGLIDAVRSMCEQVV